MRAAAAAPGPLPLHPAPADKYYQLVKGTASMDFWPSFPFIDDPRVLTYIIHILFPNLKYFKISNSASCL
jgi:hypothetical protein